MGLVNRSAHKLHHALLCGVYTPSALLARRLFLAGFHDPPFLLRPRLVALLCPADRQSSASASMTAAPASYNASLAHAAIASCRCACLCCAIYSNETCVAQTLRPPTLRCAPVLAQAVVLSTFVIVVRFNNTNVSSVCVLQSCALLWGRQ